MLYEQATETMIVQFNTHNTLYQMLYMIMIPAILYPRFMEEMNKGNIIKHIYSWKHIESGEAAHLCTHRYASGSTRIQSCTYNLLCFHPLPYSQVRKFLNRLKNSLQLCTRVWVLPPLNNEV